MWLCLVIVPGKPYQVRLPEHGATDESNYGHFSQVSRTAPYGRRWCFMNDCLSRIKASNGSPFSHEMVLSHGKCQNELAVVGKPRHGTDKFMTCLSGKQRLFTLMRLTSSFNATAHPLEDSMTLIPTHAPQTSCTIALHTVCLPPTSPKRIYSRQRIPPRRHWQCSQQTHSWMTIPFERNV